MKGVGGGGYNLSSYLVLVCVGDDPSSDLHDEYQKHQEEILKHIMVQ